VNTSVLQRKQGIYIYILSF